MIKKILFALTLLICVFFAQAQNPIPADSIFSPPQAVANAPKTIGITNVIQAKKGFINAVFTDTTAANAYSATGATGGYRIKYYPGAQIFTTSDSSFWIRNSLATRWMKPEAGNIDITSFTFDNDTTGIICFSNGVCDTFSIVNLFNVVTNIVQNFADSTIFHINDSTLLICTGEGTARVCDTIHLGSTNTFYFTITGDTLITCDTVQTICNTPNDCYQQQLCDTIVLSHPPPIAVFQNGIQSLPSNPNIKEFGAPYVGNTPADILHDTWLFTNPYQLTLTGRASGRPNFVFEQTQWSQTSSSVIGIRHNGAYTPNFPLPDLNNPVGLFFNYTDRFVIPTQGAFAGDTLGFMYDRYGYLLMTNSQGTQNSYTVNDFNAKQVGIMFHTYDTDYTDAVTIFGNQVPSSYPFTNTGGIDSTLLNSRISVFKTTGQIQLPKYINDNFADPSPVYALGVDNVGNVVPFPPSGGGGPVTTVALQNSLWVAKNGSDATGTRNRVDKPYLTIRAAVTAAQAGDVVIVIAGDYETASPIKIKNGVNFQFIGKGTVTLLASVSSGHIFTDSSSAVTSVIDAPGWTFTAVSSQRVFNFGAASNITIYANQIISNNGMTLRAGGGSNVNVHANKLYGNAFAGAIWLDSCSSFYGTFDIIQVGAFGNAIWTENVADASIKAKRIFADPTNADFLIHVAASNATDSLYFEADEIRAGTNWVIWAVGESPYVYLKGKTISANSDCVVTSSLISGGALTVEAQIITDTHTGTIDGVVHAEGGLLHLIGATIVNLSSAGADLLTRTISGDIGNITLNAVVYDKTKVNEVAAGTIKRIDRDFYASDYVANFTNKTTAGNTANPTLVIDRQTSGTPNPGLGAEVDFKIQSSTTLSQLANYITSRWSDATDATRTAQFIIGGTSSGTPQDLMYLEGNGQLQLVKYVTGSFNGGTANDSVLVATSTGVVKKRNAASFGITAITADNGLTANTATNVQLGSNAYPGSPLLHDTYISNAGFTMFMVGNGAAPVFNIQGNGSTGVVTDGGTTGLGIQASSRETWAGVFISNDLGTTNVSVAAADIRNTANTAADGIGVAHEFYVQSSTSLTRLSNQIISKLVTANDATRTSQLDITGVTSASTETWLSIGQSGFVKFRPMTVTEAGALSTAEGLMVFVSNTNGTFTSIGPWMYYNGAWHAL